MSKDLTGLFIYSPTPKKHSIRYDCSGPGAPFLSIYIRRDWLGDYPDANALDILVTDNAITIKKREN